MKLKDLVRVLKWVIDIQDPEMIWFRDDGRTPDYLACKNLRDNELCKIVDNVNRTLFQTKTQIRIHHYMGVIYAFKLGGKKS